VKFEGHKRSSVPAELIPMLVVGSKYENKTRIRNSTSQHASFYISDEPEALITNAGTNWFQFRTGSGDRVQVRQIELARCLFLNNFHLTRTAFRHDGLSGLAQVSESDEATVIKLSAMADFPPNNLRNKAALQHLSWMILDEKARKSFGSILGCWMEAEHEPWTFWFKPPSVKGWRISGSGFYGDGEAKGTFTIDEITRLHNPIFNHPKRIIVDHPRFEIALSKSPENGIRPKIPRTVEEDPELILDMEPELGNQLDEENDTAFEFSFEEDLDIEVQVNGTRYRVKPRVDGELKKTRETASPGHAVEQGSGRELNYGINRSEENVDLIIEEFGEAELTTMARHFKETMKKLSKRPHFFLVKEYCFKMRWPGEAIITANRTIQASFICYVVDIKYHKVPVRIFEVDVEGLPGKRTIRTLFAVFKDNVELSTQKILHNCFSNSVNWDYKQMEKLCVTYGTSKHPRKKTSKNTYPVDVLAHRYQERWVAILEKHISSMVSGLKETQ
jgi:hypothetical protein